MPTITCTLTHKKYSPWGLFTSETKPRYLIWLSETVMTDTVDRSLLTEMDVARIRQSAAEGIIRVSGLEPEERPAPPPIRVPYEVSVNGDPQTMDVGALLRRQREQQEALMAKQREELESLLVGKKEESPSDDEVVARQRAAIDRREVDQFTTAEDRLAAFAGLTVSSEKVMALLEKPAPILKRELSAMAATNAPNLPFFRQCKKAEEEGKARKTVISLLIQIIREKASSAVEDISFSDIPGRSSLADAYFDAIESEDGEVETIERDPSSE